MEKVTVLVGKIASTGSNARLVEFDAETLAEHRQYGTHEGGPTDTRGTTERLFKLADGRLAVHVENWSCWVGEATTHNLHEITEADLIGDGDFWALGREAGMGKPLSFDEAVTPREGIEGDAQRLARGCVAVCAVCGRTVDPGDDHHTTTEDGVICGDCGASGDAE